jgi:hypothetical protein
MTSAEAAAAPISQNKNATRAYLAHRKCAAADHSIQEATIGTTDELTGYDTMITGALVYHASKKKKTAVALGLQL